MAHHDSHDIVFPEGSDALPQVGAHPEFRPGAHHETDDVRAGTILSFGVGLVIFTVVVAAGVAFAMGLVDVGMEGMKDKTLKDRPMVMETEGLFPGPKLSQENPVLDTPEILAADEARLRNYAPAKDGEAARIPIDRAIQILSDRGKLPEPPVTSDTVGEPTPSDAVRRARVNPAPQPPVPVSPSRVP
jgi:hypothetical protein